MADVRDEADASMKEKEKEEGEGGGENIGIDYGKRVSFNSLLRLCLI